MNFTKPLKSKSTREMIRKVFPGHFKLNDESSNGYKLINLIYGQEIDESKNNLDSIYNNSFLDSIDISDTFDIYEVNLSGLSNSDYLNSSGIPIKISSEYEFYNGDITRLNQVNKFRLPIENYTTDADNKTKGFENTFPNNFDEVCGSNSSGIVGFEYMRIDPRGSGLFMVNSDISEIDAYNNSKYPSHVITVNRNFQDSGDFINTYGFFTGIENQDFESNRRYEIVNPYDSQTLSGRYPLYREVVDESGIYHSVDHYTPNKGWTRDENGNVVAVNDFPSEYYYDGTDKIYYRTAKNNPYGFGNYNTTYVDLEHSPISGSLKLYDIDILNISGEAVEIPSSGKTLYYYNSPYMLTGDDDGTFDPTYMGYESTVPSGSEFGEIQGSGATPIKTTTWDYMHEGHGIDDYSLNYVDGSGDITSTLKITNPHSRYLVEYKYKVYNKSKFISSSDSLSDLSLVSNNPIMSLTANSGDYQELIYEFTKDPDVTPSKVITFDGLDIRPNRYLHHIDFNIPTEVEANNLINFVNKNIDKKYIGYSNDFVPQITTSRNTLINCNFNESVVSGSVTESDLSGNGNNFIFNNTGNSDIYKINIGSSYGKKIIRGTGDSYYSLNGSFIKDYLHIYCKFRSFEISEGILVDINDNSNDGESLAKQIKLKLESNGKFRIISDGHLYISRFELSPGRNFKEIILKYSPDELSSSIPTFDMYYKDNTTLGFNKLSFHKTTTDEDTVSSSYINIFKNINVDIDKFKLYYEID